MATIYICKCGRRVSKSTNADNTGNRDTENCKGCPYLLPWGPMEWTGKSFEQNVKGHECRMSPEISYATDYSGSADDKCTLKIHSLDLDFLEDVQAWIDEYADGQLSGRFSRDIIRGTDYCNKGRYSWSISCAQNKKGMAAKAALIERFFGTDKYRLDKTPEEEKAIVLAAIEAGKAKAQERKENMDYIISKHEATGRLYAYYKGSLWFWDEHVQKWLLSQFAEDLYQERRKGEKNFTREDLLSETAGFYLLDEYEVDRSRIAALLQCNPKTAIPAPVSAESPEIVDECSEPNCTCSDCKRQDCTCAGGCDAGDRGKCDGEKNCAQDGCTYTAKHRENPTSLAVTESSGPADLATSAAADADLPGDCVNCQCRTCAEPCDELDCESHRMRFNPPYLCQRSGEYSCNEYVPPETNSERKDAQCQKENAPSAAAAATLDESAARMCEGSDEETQTTPVAASGAALESLHAQAVPQSNEPARDIAADAPSAQAFDYSGLDDQTVADLHLAEREYSSGKKMAEMGLRRMADAVAIAHDVLVANCEGHNQHSEDTFSAWCQSIGLKKDSAYRMLQVSKLMDGSSPREQKVLEELSPSLLYAAAKPSAPAELVQAVKDGEITTHKQYQEALAEIKARDAKIQELLEMSENSDRRADRAEAKAKKAEQERDAARDAQANLSAMANKFSKQRDAAEQRVEDAERRAQAAEEDAAGWKQAGLEMQELVDQRDERIRELESGITVEAAAVDQEEIERRANELSEPLVKIIDQQNAQIKRMASGNTVSAQASVLEQYLGTMKTSLLGNARRAELASYDIGALDSLAQALREFADEIDGLFEEGEENEDQQGET